ncbi:GNAT family N-acetyltransferase [Paraburkholderia caledonica]|uniref:Ribosomal protein S18 acetylase RimI-like enzyme n=1 Tax=Paraburkholderia caledonica TaxID=134536 RepID=A0AB73IP13_9BURK|nr:ribosomal protein S18 acetylase RimI-like enzyme [Paraburkholderia caledonica]
MPKTAVPALFACGDRRPELPDPPLKSLSLFSVAAEKKNFLVQELPSFKEGSQTMSQSRRNNLAVRRLAPAEWVQAFPVISQLRSLDESEFLRRVRQQSYSGYELVGAFKDRELVGVMGMRPVHTLARGAYMHIDDIVVTPEARGSGTGQALMEYVEADARARGMSAVFLDARPEAISFYERQNYLLHAAPSMKKSL